VLGGEKNGTLDKENGQRPQRRKSAESRETDSKKERTKKKGGKSEGVGNWGGRKADAPRVPFFRGQGHAKDSGGLLIAVSMGVEKKIERGKT